jgi:hypothetical protein
MRFHTSALVAVLAVVAACGSHQSGGMTGPSMNNRMEDQPPPPDIQSNDILARDAVTLRAKVKHILIGWRDLADNYGGNQDPRGADRSRAAADALAVKLLERVRAGEAIEPLMSEFSEDPGSSSSGIAYEVTPDAKLVFEFKRLSLRLNVGEAGLVMTEFGWHVIQRAE